MIDRSRWITGTALDYRRPELRDASTGMMDAMGFYAEQVLGLRPAVLEKYGQLSMLAQYELLGEIPWLRERICVVDSPRWLGESAPLVAEELILEYNDRKKLHPIRREAALRRFFKKYAAVDVEFTGSYREGTKRARG